MSFTNCIKVLSAFQFGINLLVEICTAGSN